MASKRERRIVIHAFASMKGGVGKSCLAVTCAKLLAHIGRKPLVVDCDMTGTSLADGLQLLAPKLPLGEDGKFDWFQYPTGEFHSREETLRLRRLRRYAPLDGNGMPALMPPPYLNDMLRFLEEAYSEKRTVTTPRFDAGLWRHPGAHDGLEYLPSSPCKYDVATSLGWLQFEHDPDLKFRWMRLLFWILYVLVDLRKNLTDIVIDLPPGILAFTHEVLVALSLIDLEKKPIDGYPRWSDLGVTLKANPFLVLSPDRNDLLPGLEYWGETKSKVPSLRPLINRATEAKEDIFARILDALGDGVSPSYFEDATSMVDDLPMTLGKVFRQGAFQMTPDVQALMDILRLKGCGA